MFLRLVRSLLKSLLQLVQFLAQLGKLLLCWIGFLTCLLGSPEIGFCRPVFLILVAIFGSMHSMHAPMFLAQLARLLKTDILVRLLRGTITGPLGSCLLLVRSFLAGWCMGFLMGTYTLDSFKRSLKRTHIHESHTLFLQVVLVLPLVRTHPENVSQIRTRAVVPAGQLRDVGVELLYALDKLAYANPLGLLEHVGKVVFFLLRAALFGNTVRRWNITHLSNDSRKSPLGPFLDTP